MESVKIWFTLMAAEGGCQMGFCDFGLPTAGVGWLTIDIIKEGTSRVDKIMGRDQLLVDTLFRYKHSEG